jgi:hypothetical protein
MKSPFPAQKFKWVKLSCKFLVWLSSNTYCLVQVAV